jgi:hypothetical protein
MKLIELQMGELSEDQKSSENMTLDDYFALCIMDFSDSIDKIVDKSIEKFLIEKLESFFERYNLDLSSFFSYEKNKDIIDFKYILDFLLNITHIKKDELNNFDENESISDQILGMVSTYICKSILNDDFNNNKNFKQIKDINSKLLKIF